MNKNFIFLNSIADISEDAFKEIEKITVFKKVKAGTQIVKLNEVPTKVYMLVSGAIRCYICTESGKEFNKSFYLPTSFVGSLTALLKTKPSMLVFETISDCKIYEVDYYKLMQLCDNDPKLKSLYTNILEVLYVEYEKRLVEMISMDATSRYLELRRKNPNIDELISQYHIASYLGVTAVQLSRIKKKIHSY